MAMFWASFMLLGPLAAHLFVGAIYLPHQHQSFHPDENLVSDFWQGLDIKHERRRGLAGVKRRGIAARRHRRAAGESPSAHVSGGEQAKKGGQKSMVLLGPFDTGTNLLIDTLNENYPRELEQACHLSRITIDNDLKSHCRLWKHGLNISDATSRTGGEPVYTVIERQGLQVKDTVAVMIVRSPLATLTGWKKSGYDLAPCTRRMLWSYDEPCSTPTIQWCRDGVHTGCNFATKQFSSTMDAYNTYMRLYRALQNEGKLHGAVLVTYEDLVFSPGDVVGEIAEAIGWAGRESVTIIDEPAKNHGQAHGRDLALRNLRERSWLTGVIEDRVLRKELCALIDMSLLEGLVDNKYDPNEPSLKYSADCDGLDDLEDGEHGAEVRSEIDRATAGDGIR